MRRARLPLAFIAALALAPTLALTLASCGAVHWQKANGDDSALSQDLTACRKQASERIVRTGSAIPRSELSPVFGPLGPSPAEMRMQEAQSVNGCMREKGYVLVPDSAPAGK